MDINEIDQTIKYAVYLKHQGKIDEAIAIEESCLKRCKSYNTPKHGYAALYKALAKLYFIKGDYKKVTNLYYDAINLYGGDWREVQPCMFHLGCCSIEFIESVWFKEYRRGLEMGGEIPPGEPGSFMPMEVVSHFIGVGVDMYNNNRNIIRRFFGIFK